MTFRLMLAAAPFRWAELATASTSCYKKVQLAGGAFMGACFSTPNADLDSQKWLDQAAEKRSNAVILSIAKDLALSIFNAMRDSSSPLLLRMTALSSFSAAC